MSEGVSEGVRERVQSLKKTLHLVPVVGNLWQVESLTEVHEIEDIFLEAAATKPNTCLHTCRQRTREIKSTYFGSLDECCT